MKNHQSSPGFLCCSTLAIIAAGCVFTSSAHAAFIAEGHACKANSKTGGSWIGGYYLPATRIAVTHQKNEKFTQTLTLRTELYAYPEGGGDAVYVKRTIKTPPGVANNHISAWVTDAATAPGYLNSFSLAWYPGMVRLGGNLIFDTAAINDKGCRSDISYF